MPYFTTCFAKLELLPRRMIPKERIQSYFTKGEQEREDLIVFFFLFFHEIEPYGNSTVSSESAKLVLFQRQAKRKKSNRMKAHTMIQRPRNSSLHYRVKACI